MRWRQPTDLGILWILGLWGWQLGSQNSTALGSLPLLLLSLFILRTLAWLILDVVIAVLEHPQYSVFKILAKLPVALRWFVVVLLFFCLVILLWLGWQALLIAAVAALLAGLFLYVRHYSFLGELLLALSLACVTLLGFAATGTPLGKTAWLIYTVAVLWLSACLMQYAALHLQEHIRLGINSITMLFGRADRWIIALLQALALISFGLLGQQEKLGMFMHIAIAVGFALGIYQQYLMAAASERGYRRAWRNNLWFGLALLCGLTFQALCLCPSVA